jgi:hypothetical protein
MVLKTWTLPLLVAAIAIPIAAGFALGGEAAGLGAGALVAAALIVWAARSKPDEQVEVAGAGDERRRILVLASEEIDDPATVTRIAEAAGVDGAEADAEVLILAPARTGFLDRWATDVQGAREEAQRKLVVTVASLAAADVEARGAVGDHDLVQAAEDKLRSFPATEVIVVTGSADRDEAGTGAAAELARRLPIPLKHMVTGGRPTAHPVGSGRGERRPGSGD